MLPTLRVIGGPAPLASGACQRVVPAEHLVRRDRDLAELVEQRLDGSEPALGFAARGSGARRCAPCDRAQSPVHPGDPWLLLESSKPLIGTDRRGSATRTPKGRNDSVMPRISADEYRNRLECLQAEVARAGLDLFLVSSFDSIYYLNGAGFEPLERPFFLFVTPPGRGSGVGLPDHARPDGDLGSTSECPATLRPRPVGSAARRSTRRSSLPTRQRVRRRERTEGGKRGRY